MTIMIGDPTLSARVAILPFALCPPLIVLFSLRCIFKLTQSPLLRLSFWIAVLGAVMGCEQMQCHVHNWIIQGSHANDDAYLTSVVLLQNLAGIIVGVSFFSRIRQRD